MDDKRLLELAAKAAGIEYTHAGEMICGSPYLYAKNVQLGMWVPLTDDGDALRLATTLSLTVAIKSHEVEVFEDGGECLCSIPIFTASTFVSKEHATDKNAAVRLAIVTAAAAIANQGDSDGY
jgi:hypothetical protein